MKQVEGTIEQIEKQRELNKNNTKIGMHGTIKD